MHSNVTIKNVSWPHFSWATLYIGAVGRNAVKIVQVTFRKNTQCGCVRCVGWTLAETRVSLTCLSVDLDDSRLSVGAETGVVAHSI